MQTEWRSTLWCLISFTLLIPVAAPYSSAASEDSRQAKRNRMAKYQSALLKGRVVISNEKSDAGRRTRLDPSEFSNVVRIGCACDAKVYVRCDPNQKELVISDQPKDVHVDDSRPGQVSVSLTPWAKNVHLSVRTPELLQVGASGNVQWYLSTGNMRALRAGSSGTNTVTGTGTIDIVDFGSSGTNHLDGASFIINDAIIGSSGTNTAVVAPQRSLYVHGAGTTKVKSLTHPPYFDQDRDSEVEFVRK